MSPEKNREILNLFLSIFSDEWLSAFEVLCGIGIEESKTVGSVEEQIILLDDNLKGLDGKPLDDSLIIDTLRDAKAFFKVYWEIFKFKCAERRLILTKEEALALVRNAVCCREVWQEIIENDLDFDLFLRMERHNQEEEQIAAAKMSKEEALVKKLERQQAVRRALERNLLKSKYVKQYDRLKVCFAEELEQVIRELENEGIASGPHEMSAMLAELFPHIPKSLHMLLNQYVPRLREIRDNPKPKLKNTIYGSEKKPWICISKVEIDHTSGSLKLGKLSFTFNAKGIVEVLNTLKKNKEYSLEEFAAEINNFLEKLREYCQKHQIPGFQNLVAKLQKKYCDLWAKSGMKKTDDDLKNGIIYTALGLLHVKLAEDHIDPEKRLEKKFKK